VADEYAYFLIVADYEKRGDFNLTIEIQVPVLHMVYSYNRELLKREEEVSIIQLIPRKMLI